MRVTIDLTEKAVRWLRANSSEPEPWYLHNGGASLLAEFQGTLDKTIIEESQAVMEEYFSGLRVPRSHSPQLRITDHYIGSWIVDVAIVMVSTAGTAYTLLKGVSEFPAIADGISDLKARMRKRLRPRLDDTVQSIMTSAVRRPTQNERLAPPTAEVVTIDVVIDSRPLLGLTPAKLYSRAIHFSVAVSRESIL